MSYKLVNIDLLTSFLESLQDSILEKHPGSKLCLDEEFDMEVRDSVSDDLAKYKLNSDPHLAATYGFQVKMYKEANGHRAGILGFCRGSFEHPGSRDDLKWGRIDVSLVTLQDSAGDLHKHLKKRGVHIGLNPSYIRKVCDGIRFMWIKEQYGFTSSHWHEEPDFKKIVKTREENGKKIQLARGQEKEDLLSQPPYCGEDGAAVIIQTSSGVWKRSVNSVVKLPEKKGHDNGEYDHMNVTQNADLNGRGADDETKAYATSGLHVKQPGMSQHDQPKVPSNAGTLLHQPMDNAALFSCPPPSLGYSYNTPGQRYYPDNDNKYDGTAADHPHSGQNVFNNDAPGMQGGWSRKKQSPPHDRDRLPRADGRHSHHWVPRDELQDTNGPYNHVYNKIDYNKVIGAPEHSPLGAIQKRRDNTGPPARQDPFTEQQLDKESLLNNVKRNLNGDFDNTRPKPNFVVEDISQRFSDAMRLDVQSEWERRVRRNRSPSPGSSRSPFLQAGIPGLPVTNATFSVGALDDRNSVLPPEKLMYQENLRQKIQATMSNLNSTQEALTNALQSEGYRLSDDDFEVELYSNRNIAASTDPTLLSTSYSQRIRIMTDVNKILKDQLKVKKERLQMLLGSAGNRRSSRIKQQGQQRKKRHNDYYYWDV